jgi:hypothetical protein
VAFEGEFEGETVVREFGDDEPASVALIMAVSELRDVDPVSLTPPLHDVVDPDALDDFFDRLDGGQEGGALELVEYGCRIRVSAEGYVEVRTVERAP